jgi:hypothetical protein
MYDCPGDTCCRKKTFTGVHADCLCKRFYRIPLIELELESTIVFQKTWGKRTDTAAIRDDMTTWEHSSPLTAEMSK